MKKKIDFFFKPYAQTSDAKENFHMLSNFEPIHFDNPVSPKKSIENEEKYFHKKAIDKWNNLSNTIFKKDNGKLRKLLYTMNGDMYHQLKEFAQNLNSKSGKKQSSANRSINQSDMSNQSSFIKEGYKMLDNIISKEKKVVFKEDKNHLNVNSLNDFKLLKKQSIITPLMMLKRGQTNNKRHSVKKSKRPSSLAPVSEFKTKSDKVNYDDN